MLDRFFRNLDEISQTADAIASALGGWDAPPEGCEDGVTRALVALEDVHRGLERTAPSVLPARNEGGPPGWILRTNLELISRLAKKLSKDAAARPQAVQEWMRGRVVRSLEALGDALRSLLGSSDGRPVRNAGSARTSARAARRTRGNPPVPEGALRKARDRMAAAERWAAGMTALSGEILEDARPFFRSAPACEEVQGLLPRRSFASFAAWEARRACGSSARPRAPGEGALPPRFAEELLDKSRRFEQLEELLERAVDASWRDLEPHLGDAQACRQALDALHGEAAGHLAVRVRNRLLELQDAAAAANPGRRRRNPIPETALDEIARMAEMAKDMHADANRIGRELREGVLPFLTTRRACDEFRGYAPRGSFLSFTVMIHRDDLPPDPPGAPGMPDGLLEALGPRLERMSRAWSAWTQFDQAAVDAVRPHAHATTPDDLRRIVARTPRGTTIRRMAAERLGQAALDQVANPGARGPRRSQRRS